MSNDSNKGDNTRPKSDEQKKPATREGQTRPEKADEDAANEAKRNAR